MASNNLRGHGGQCHTPYNLRTNELRLHVKFQPPSFTCLAVHKPQTEVETKRGLANICLDTDCKIPFIQIHFVFGSLQ